MIDTYVQSLPCVRCHGDLNLFEPYFQETVVLVEGESERVVAKQYFHVECPS